MTPLIPIISVALVTAGILCLVHLNLYQTFGGIALRVWTYAWAAYALRFVFDIMRYLEPWVGWAVLVQLAATASGLLLLWGVRAFAKSSSAAPVAWIVAATAAALWTVASPFFGAGTTVAAVPSFFYLGAANLAIAWHYWRKSEAKATGRNTVIAAFLLWGIHKFDYPILRPIPELAVWGYVAGSVLATAAGVGLLTLFMSAERNRAVASESRFRSLVDSIVDVVFTLDGEGRHTGLYGAWRGGDIADPGLSIGYSAVDQFGPEEGRMHVEAAHRVFSENKAVTYEWELDASESKRYFQTMLAPIRGLDGACVEVVGVAREVTDLRTALGEVNERLAEKEVLVREIHHRVKNNIQLITSLLALQARYVQSPQAEGALSASIERVRALSDVHEMLYDSEDAARVRISDFVGRLVNRVFYTRNLVSPPRITVEAEGVFLPLDTAVPFSLILTELVADSAERLTEIAIPICHVTLQRTEHQLELVIEDNGSAGPPELDGVQLLRQNLVETLVAQLQAEYRRTRDNGTVRTQIVVPLISSGYWIS